MIYASFYVCNKISYFSCLILNVEDVTWAFKVCSCCRVYSNEEIFVHNNLAKDV